MSSNPRISFTHNHHLLAVKGCASELDVLAFEGDEALSRPFSYRIEFTSAVAPASGQIQPLLLDLAEQIRLTPLTL
jgi:uncharacterized protein involved in type VI secretion and phage assembly